MCPRRLSLPRPAVTVATRVTFPARCWISACPGICEYVGLGYSHVMEDTSKGMPQFATAEFAPTTPALTCAACRRSITGPYYQINGVQACADCATKVQQQIPKDSHAAFVRALVFGIAGALV